MSVRDHGCPRTRRGGLLGDHVRPRTRPAGPVRPPPRPGPPRAARPGLARRPAAGAHVALNVWPPDAPLLLRCSPAMPPARDCPCCSGLPYARCCAPYHRGEREAPSAEALMRSRFSAYARKESAYVLRTLHPDHEDRKRPEAEVMREIRDATSTLKFMRLDVLDHDGPDEAGFSHVLFHARVFEKGQDRSFIELSEFAHDGVGIRYRSGRQLAAAKVADPKALTIAAFQALL
ncbi:YchJ family protein [Polyangium jinanense]|nr:YchJ family metal-binding protein [Polyangium jinanense]